MKTDWKIGDWCEFDGTRALVYMIIHNKESTIIRYVTSGGTTDYFILGLHARYKHLPDCTGWDWVEPKPIKLEVGKWYRRKDGQIVGPCRSSSDRSKEHHPGAEFALNCYWYRADGTNKDEPLQVIEEVPVPKGAYRPFTMQEFLEHVDKNFKDERNDDPNDIVQVDILYLGSKVVEFDNSATEYTLAAVLEQFTFEDGSYCGVLKDEFK